MDEHLVCRAAKTQLAYLTKLQIFRALHTQVRTVLRQDFSWTFGGHQYLRQFCINLDRLSGVTAPEFLKSFKFFW